jgi:hypothetical protein
MFLFKSRTEDMIDFLASFSVISRNASPEQIVAFIDTLPNKEKWIAAKFILFRNKYLRIIFRKNCKPCSQCTQNSGYSRDESN